MTKAQWVYELIFNDGSVSRSSYCFTSRRLALSYAKGDVAVIPASTLKFAGGLKEIRILPKAV